MIEEFTESEIRRMRDAVYGYPTTDTNWEACKEGWMKPENIQWLSFQVEKLKPKDQP